jgi:tetratricopeptide (TPR) repeat protein
VPQQQERDPAYLVRCCQAFREFFVVPGQLAVILRPSACADVAGYEQWLLSLAAATSNEVRFVVLDDAAAPMFSELARSSDRRVVSRPAALDLPAALIELSEAAGNQDTPGGRYRDQLVRMSAALQAGELGRAITHGDKAVEIAAAHDLWQLVVPVQIALGANLVAQGRQDEGLQRHLDARAAAERGAEQPDELLAGLCRKLVVQSRMAHGAALIGLRRYAEAAPLFEQTAPLAAAQGDLAVAMDCERLGSFCHEQAGDVELAWRAAVRGLDVARELEPAARKLSSFESLAEALQRMAAKRPPSSTRPVLERIEPLRREPPPDQSAPAGEGPKRA